MQFLFVKKILNLKNKFLIKQMHKFLIVKFQDHILQVQFIILFKLKPNSIPIILNQFLINKNLEII